MRIDQIFQSKVYLLFSCIALLLLIHYIEFRSCTIDHDKIHALSHTSSTTAMKDLTSFDLTNEYSTMQYVCCYRNPNNLENHVGRPFPYTKYVKDVWEEYMKTPGISHEDKKKIEVPQPATAFSSNHFEEHKKEIGTALRLFKNMKILVYDLGMSAEQIKYVDEHPNLEYRRLKFSRYPPHVKKLTTYAWKTLIWVEVLQEFDAITWFDTSMSFSVGQETFIRTVKDYIINKKSSVLMYVHETGHSTAWATHADMWSYFPSNMTKFGPKEDPSSLMSQANGVILYNTIDFKENIMKWALLCVLTEDCIAPYRIDGKQSTKWCPKAIDTQKQPYICHRFDQSLFSLLAHNYYFYDKSIYQIQGSSKFLGCPSRDKMKVKKYDDRGIAIN